MSSGKIRYSKRLRTIGARLTLWGVGVTLLACAVLCGVLYTGLFFSLRLEVDTFLEGEVHEFTGSVNSYPNDYAGLEEYVRRELGSRTRRDLAFRLFDANSRIIVSSEANDPLAGLWVAPANWNHGNPRIHCETIRTAAYRYPLRACSLRINAPDGRTCTAQASYSLNRMTSSLALFRRVCIVGFALAAILAVAAGRILARRSLRPVQTVTETAQRIGADSLTERIPLAGTDDELDRLAMTLNNMLDRIEHHVSQVLQFTADASHELRSPLAALRGNAEVALTRPRSAGELRQVIEDAIEHYDRLARIAEDLLLLARADTGHLVLRSGQVRFDLAIEDAIDLYTPLAHERGIRLRFDDRLRVWVQGDSGRLRQLAGNLIDNAIKYTGENGSVIVSLLCTNRMAYLTVADTGQGIPAEHLSRVFDRFYQVDRARSAQRGGAGLGLSICRMIAQAHGGQISISSTAGEGTSVTVAIPVDAHGG